MSRSRKTKFDTYELLDGLLTYVFFFFVAAIPPVIMAMAAFEGLHAHYRAVPAFGFWDLFISFVALKFLVSYLIDGSGRRS